MRHVVSHDLDEHAAQRVAQRATDSYRERYARFSPKVEWLTEKHCRVRFSVRGVTVAGEVLLLPRAIEMRVEVPLLLRPFRGQALRAIDREVHRWVERARKGEI